MSVRFHERGKPNDGLDQHRTHNQTATDAHAYGRVWSRREPVTLLCLRRSVYTELVSGSGLPLPNLNEKFARLVRSGQLPWEALDPLLIVF